jgi:hypothetical protein
MFWRSFIDFEGLTSDEVLARLFIWYFGPSFVAFFFTLSIGSADVRSGPAYLGIAFTAFVVWRDAQQARIERPWAWAAVAGLVPLVGWWAYGRRRAPLRTQVARAYPGRAPALVRYLHPFWRTRLTLITHLSSDECGRRLNRLCVHWTSPSEWLSRQDTRPVQGKASRRGFTLKWRHALTRPGGLPQASGRFEARAGATVVRLWLGMSVLDGMFFVMWIAVAVLVGVPGAITPSASAPSGFGVFWLSGWVGIGLLMFTMIRWISRDDDIRLRRLILEALEAEEVAS